MHVIIFNDLGQDCARQGRASFHEPTDGARIINNDSCIRPQSPDLSVVVVATAEQRSGAGTTRAGAAARPRSHSPEQATPGQDPYVPTAQRDPFGSSGTLR